jgi:hypothetical protein
MSQRLLEASRNMTQTLDKEKAVICRTQTKIRVSAAVYRLILAKIKWRGLERHAVGTDATAQPHSPSTPKICPPSPALGLSYSSERSIDTYVVLNAQTKMQAQGFVRNE